MPSHPTIPPAAVLLFFLSTGCNPPDDSGATSPATPTRSHQEAEVKRSPLLVAAQQDVATTDSATTAGERRRNRLASETSPYLLQHAENPVDWFPWGEVALAKAKQENKVIFLSIGYSSCHWCHVMERESFIDPEIAAFLNEHFVCIKVDREERPDVDAVYMAATQALTGRGGWPLSVFLTPDAKPFFGGTYFPARDGDRPGAIGFLTIAGKVADLWSTKEEDLRGSAEALSKHLQSALSGGSEAEAQEAIAPELVERAFQNLRSDYDASYGGFGYSDSDPNQPKFPQAANLFLLVQLADAPIESDAEGADATPDRATSAREMLVTTLDHLAMGGIRDHLGGGFHRYSVDRFWSIPHFEKMLYDNGQLASVYAEAYRLTGHEEYARVIDEMFAFLQREMSTPAGAFYAALDADSEHEEGKFYRWEVEELREELGAAGWEEFSSLYATSGRPNFENQYFVPQLDKPFRVIAADRGLAEPLLHARLAVWRERLLAKRSRRERPGTDSKVITSWNGMMIRGLADAGRILEKPAYVERATLAAEFALDKLRTEDGRLLRTYSGGAAKLNAYVNDYACLIDGLLAIHRATRDEKWLTAATSLMDKQLELFWDETNGGFFFTSSDHEELIVRGKHFADDAVPAGNSVSAGNLIYLGTTLDRPEYLDRARRTIEAAASLLNQAPHAAPRLVAASMQLPE